MADNTPKMDASKGHGSDTKHQPSNTTELDPESGTGPVDSEFGPAPDGGLEAWLAVAGASGIFFCCLGFSNSFGIFAEYYLTHQLQHESPDAIAWIGSSSICISFFAGLVGGPLFDRYGGTVSQPI
jgi:hypothetical protein